MEFCKPGYGFPCIARVAAWVSVGLRGSRIVIRQVFYVFLPMYQGEIIIMKKLFAGLVAVLTLLLGLVPLVGAQGDSCMGLPAEDCALIEAAAANTDAITSFTHNISLSLTTAGLSSLGEQDIAVNISGTGPFVFTGDSAMPVSMGLDLLMDIREGAETTSESVSFALTGNFLYLPMDDEIVGIPLTDAVLEELAMSGAMMGLPVGPDMLIGDPDAEINNLGDLLGDDMGDLGDLEIPPEFEAFITYERRADEQVMGRAMAPFALTVDIAGLLNSPEIAELFGMLGGMGGGDEELEMILMFLPMLLADAESVLSVTQYVDTQANIIPKLTVEFGLSIDLSMLMAMGGEGDIEMDPIVVDFLLDVELSDIDAAPAVSAPAGARELSEEEALSLMRGF
jgi:hypothetical protein